MKLDRLKQFKTDCAVISLFAAAGLFPILVAVFIVTDLCTDIFVQPAYAEPKNTSTTTSLPRSRAPSADKNAAAVRALLRTAPDGDGNHGNTEDSGDGAQSDVEKAAEMIRSHKASGEN